MSLDVHLTAIRPTQVHRGNITHNLVQMAAAAGIYEALWRPEENGITTAAELVPLLEAGLSRLRAAPDEFKKHNPPNGWGSYDGLVQFVSEYLVACQENPDAKVTAWR